MQVKTIGIFASLCSAAVVPYTLFNSSFKLSDNQVATSTISLAGEGESELKELDNFFVTYCRKVNESMIVCKNRESFPWPEFYFVDREEGSGKPQKIQSFVFQMVNKVPTLEIELEQGKKQKIDGFTAGLAFKFFDKLSLDPDADCILLDSSAGGANQKPNSIACKIERDSLGGKWVNLPW